VIVKFNKFERVAGLFVIIAACGAVFLTGVAAVKKGWFATKIPFHTEVASAEGLREGTPVTMSGLRAGEVTDVELVSADKIIVHFAILEKFHKQLKSDSQIMAVRPFVLGDKVLELSVGSDDKPELAANSEVPTAVTVDMMDLVSGRKLGPFLGTLEGLMLNMSTLAKAFADPKRTDSFVKMFDRMDPLIMNLSHMSSEVTKLAGELNQFVPQMRAESPEIGREVSKLVGQLNLFTTTLAPALQEVGPELPRVSRRTVEALDEMVVTLKAIQKSFLLSGKVQDVRDEEREKDERQRKPAATGK
jgi:phospholipid/cholesterol/gamma-HCH transport system substrate-binding protein